MAADYNRTEAARDALASAKRVLVLTGAGISAESGVPTFRGGGGAAVWRGMPFEQLSSAEMVESDLPLVWEWFDYRRNVVGKCGPNPGHLAIAAAQNSGRFGAFALVTQNIDGLHAAAGSGEFMELHGNINRARCLSCGFLQDLDSIPEDERPPVCPECFDSMRPDVVLFGEGLLAENIYRARDAAENCDVCIVVGTSGVVYPANELPLIARRSGAVVIEINPEPTVLTPLCDISIRSASAEALPKIFNISSAATDAASW